MTSSRLTFLRHVWIVLFCALIFGVAQFHRAAGGIVSPILARDLNLTASVLGGVIGAMFISTVSMQVPAGIALDRYGVRRVVPLLLGVSGIGSILFSMSDDIGEVLVARVLLGVGFASTTAGAYVLFARWFPQDRFATLSGLMIAIGGVGGLSGTYPLAALVEVYGWRPVFTAVGGFTLAVAALGYVTIRDRPPGAELSYAGPGSIRETLLGYRRIFGEREFYKLLALGLVTFAPITSIAGLWGGPYFQQVYGLGGAETGLILFSLFLSTMLAGLVFGPLDRFFGTRKGVILGGASISILSLGVLAAWPGISLSGAIACLLAMTFCQQFYLPLAAHNRALFPDHLIGRASTLLNLVSVAGIPLMQSGVGLVLDFGRQAGFDTEASFRLAFACIAAALLVGTLVYATAADMKPGVSKAYTKGDK